MSWNLFNKVPLAILLAIVATSCKSSMKTASTSPVKPTAIKAPLVSGPSRNEAEEQGKLYAMKESIYKGRLLQYFDAITNSDNLISANSSIDHALTLFASSQVRVLIVNDEKNGQKNYGKPTSIRAYLNLIKDQKFYDSRIENVKLDKYGKIIEVELRKMDVITSH